MDAKSLLALANLNKRDRYLTDRAKLQAAKKEDWRWVGYDSTIGMGVVRSGNITKRGKVITNGYLVPGQSVEFNEDGQFATIEGMPHIKPQPRRKPQYVPREPTSPSIAILFEANKDGGSRGLYVGGLTPEPIEVFAPGSGFVSYETPAIYKIDNIGEGAYKIATQSVENIGLLSEWSTPNSDQKISPATTIPESRVLTDIYAGSGIFVGRTDYTIQVANLPFWLGPGPYVEGQSGTATWSAGVRTSSPTVQHTAILSGSAVLLGGTLETSGNGSYVFPDGSQELVSINRGAVTTSYRDVRVMACESPATFLYRVTSYSGPRIGDFVGSAANPIVSEYYYYNGGTRTKVAESATVNFSVAAVSGHPIEIESAFELSGRLVGTSIFTPLTDFFGLGGQPSDPMTGTYEVQEIDLFGGVTQKTYNVNPIPANYSIPSFIFGGSRIWNASFNFEL